MKNFAIVRVPSVMFSSEKIQGHTIYRGVDEFEQQIAKRLHSNLSESGAECGVVKRSHKPIGLGFKAVGPPGEYYVTVSVEREVLPGTEVTIGADPCGNAVQSWIWFEPLFRRAVDSGFPDCEPIWMTEDEFVESKPGV